MKTVVLLTNFSETSRKAIINYLKVYAQQNNEDSHFLLLNTFMRVKTGQSQLVKFDDILEQYSKLDLEKEIRNIHSVPELKNIKIETLSRHGDLVDVVEQLNRERGVDLIVMGTKGSNILKELLLVSDTDRLIRLSKNPVLVIPESVEFTKPYKIVFATHLEERKNKNEFRKLIGIIKSFDAELLILNVYTEKKPAVTYFENRMKIDLEEIKHRFFYVKNDDVADGITKFVQLNKAGLLSIVDHRVSILSKLFRHSVSGKLTMSAELPLLIIHE